MNTSKPTEKPLGWGKSILWLVVGVVCFHLAYTSLKWSAAGLFIFGYALALVRLTDQPTVRRAFYFGLTAGFLCAAPQLFFFWKVFGAAAIVLWLVFAFWIGLFAAIVCGSIRRWGKVKGLWLVPVVWTGIEYFRSELYYLKFSWLNAGDVFPNYLIPPFLKYGVYGIGFLIFATAIVVFSKAVIRQRIAWFLMVLFFLSVFAYFLGFIVAARYETPKPPLSIVGIQLEFPPAGIIPNALNNAFKKHPDAQIFVLSEYTLGGGVPDSLRNWCREHSRFLVVGGEDIVTKDVYYDTAFVVGTNGETVFKQAKCVPIQFFRDGLPAREQKVWNSPWGKIGICICYDLSYTRVTDELLRQGAQLLIVPTMDVDDWGRHEHELHSRIAPVRAAEYGIPIFRVASSGVSQAVTGYGNVVAKTSIGGVDEILTAKLRLPMSGSLPLDRLLAPICVVVTGIVTAALLFLTWRDRHTAKKS